MDSGAGTVSMILGLIGISGVLAIFLYLIPLWRIFQKAGRPGWEAIVPIYDTVVLCKIVGKPGWWVLLCFIPVVGFIIPILLCIQLAKCFGKGSGFAVGLILLSFIFIPILGYGGAKYIAPHPAI